MKEKTDAELVLLTREGNREAFGYLVERYQQMVRRIAIRLIAGEEIACELAQEAILQAYLSLDHLRDPVSFKSWLYGITLNVCKSYLRGQKVDVLSLESVIGGMRCNTVFDDAIDPQSVVEEQELRHAVFQVVQNLSPGDRAAAQLFYYEQLTLREVATVLEVSVATVKGRLHRARKRIREQVASQYETVLPAKQRKRRMRKVTIDSVREHPETKQYVVVLKDEVNAQLIIWIGKAEAWVIAGALNEVEPPRPMSAQLMLNLLQATKSELIEVRIESLKEEIFYAILKVRSGKKTQDLDARPSDALALAALAKCPIYITQEVLEKCTGFPEGKLVRPISTFTVIDREATLKEQEERKTAFLKMATALPEIEALLHKQEQEQARQALVEDWKKARNAPES
jgi:RNA polymerase sigma factor (sigma-70 family)